jgi:hypothetical protein
MSITASGEKKCCEPSMWLRKRTPSSVILRRFLQAKHLEAAAVGEDRAVPADEAVDPARAPDELLAGAQVEVVVFPRISR